MLSAVPGLSTTTGTNGVSAITMALPTLVHAILGFGLPDAVQVKFNLSPSTAVAVLFDISTDGGTETQIEPLNKRIKGWQRVMDKPEHTILVWHVSRLSMAHLVLNVNLISSHTKP